MNCEYYQFAGNNGLQAIQFTTYHRANWCNAVCRTNGVRLCIIYGVVCRAIAVYAIDF